MTTEALLTRLQKSFESLAEDLKSEEIQDIAFKGAQAIKTHKTQAYAIHDWERLIGKLVRWYFMAHQASESASYINPGELDRASGHGEPAHMRVLRRAEYGLQSGQHLADSEERVAQASDGMLDVFVTERLTEKQLIKAYEHWREAMTEAFPALMTQGRQFLLDRTLNRLVAQNTTLRMLVERSGRKDLLK